MRKERKHHGLYYKLLCYGPGKIFPKQKFVSKSIINSDEGAVFICNHAKAYGPIAVCMDFPYKFRPWIIGDILSYKTAPSFIYKDFFRGNGKENLFFKALSYLVSLILVPALNGSKRIPVYTDKRIINTFSQSVSALKNKEQVIVFPEFRETYSQFINNIQDGFILLGTFYYKKTGKKLKFYPMYIAPQLRTMNVGKYIEFNPENNVDNEKARIKTYLLESIDTLAKELPKHQPIQF